MDHHIFCNAPNRVPICRLDTNLCCVICMHNATCLTECKDMGIHPRPCMSWDGDDEEQRCEFEI